MGEITDFRSLTGQDKAALFMLALGEEHSKAIWPLMDDEEIKELSQNMANLGNVPSDVVEKLFLEFVGSFTEGGAVQGSFNSTERLLAAGLPADRVAAIMEEIRGPAGRTMWDKLANVHENVLASYLKNEYPQTVAVVLSKIRPEHSAKVLGVLPEEFSMEVVMRMLRMETVQKEVLDKVEATLRTEFMSNLARTSRRDSHEMMADIFGAFDRITEARFMGLLEERSQAAAEKIRELMFTFDDLKKLDPAATQTMLKAVEKDKLTIALKGASEAIRDMFFANMSERAAKLLREDMESMGPVRMKDVTEAQSYMVRTAKDLADRGEIVLATKAGGDDELVY